MYINKINRVIKFSSLFLFLLFITEAAAAEMIRNVPFVLQKNNFCGPAAVSSVMQYYGLKISQDTIASHVYTEKLKGALITDLENFAKKTNFLTRLDIGSTNDIKMYIRQKKPVIVLVDAGIWLLSFHHYLVVIGYDKDGFLAHTGFRKEKFVSYEDFLDMWDKMGNTYLVIYKEK